jgi:membrane associated rhomboid family serine protease
VFPLRDTNVTRSRAVVTPILIALNVIVFLFELSLGPSADAFIFHFGLVPRAVLADPSLLLTALTSMFLHGGWMHLIGNMWFLYIFGDNVEDAMGRGRFLLFYLLCGLAAAAAQVALTPDSRVPMVGASGAIAGVLAGYVRLFPRARILTLVPIFIFIQFVELPAVVFIFIWFGYQVLLSVMSLGTHASGGVALFAHVGGFAAGWILVRVLGPRRPLRARAMYS